MAHTVTIYELTLGRVLDYLTQCIVELTPAVVHEVLRLIERALDDGKEDLLPRVFAALPELIELPPPSAPRRAPAYLRRVLVFVLTVAQTVAGTYSIIAVLPYHGGTGLEQAIVVVFAVLFAWIASGCWASGLGLSRGRRWGDRISLLSRILAAILAASPLARTAS